MNNFKRLIVFTFSFIICEILVISAVSWSYLESTMISYEFLRIETENRIKDTMVSVAKASEVEINDENLKYLSIFYNHFLSYLPNKNTNFKVREVFAINAEGVLLAHSNPSKVEIPYSKRTPEDEYLTSKFQRTLHSRRFEIVYSLLEDKKKYNKIINYIKDLIFVDLRYIREMGSVPFFAPNSTKKIGTVHIVYDRGNLYQFLIEQIKSYRWMIYNYIFIGFVLSFILNFVIVLLFRNLKKITRNVSNHHAHSKDSIPKFFEKIKVPEDDLAMSKMESFSTEFIQTQIQGEEPVKAAPVLKRQVIQKKEEIKSEPTKTVYINNENEIKEAIFID